MFSPKKICVVFLVITVAYNLLVVVFEGMFLFPQNSAFQANVDIGESYYYDYQDAKNVFIGSSISQYIKFERIDSSFCLSMKGTSPIECLKIINRKEVKPDKVFIEVNVLYATEFDIAENVFFLESLKKRLPAIRQSEKPINKIMWVGLSMLHKLGLYRASSINSKLIDDNPSKAIAFKKSYIDAYVNAHIDTLQIAKNMIVFELELRKLQDSGVDIYIMEIPVNKEVLTSNRHSYLLNSISATTEKMQLDVLFFRTGSYFWTDGIHMDRESAIQFQKELVRRVNGLELKIDI